MQQRALAPIAFFLWLSGCADTADDNVLARVGTVEITVEDLQRFNADIPALQRSDEEGVQVWREYLESMIDMELLVLEARNLGLDQEPEFQTSWEDERRKKLIGEIVLREVQGKIDLPRDELRRQFLQSKWNRMLKLARIRVQTEKEAGEVVEELRQGKDFVEVAKLRSTDRETASLGGLLDPLYGRGNIEKHGMSVEVAEVLFELAVGEISPPMETGDGYDIFQVVSEGPAPYGYFMIYSQVELTKASRARHEELMEEMVAQFGVQLDQKGVALLLEKAPSSGADPLNLAEQEQEVVLCRFDGGQFTLKDFVDTYDSVRRFRPARFDSSGIAEFVYKELLPSTLMSRLAVKQGVVQDSAVVAWLDAKEKTMLIAALKERAVDSKIDAHDEAVRSYYESHPALFTKPEQVTVEEILCATLEEAEDVLKRIRTGEDMASLVERSIRPDIRRDGRIHMHLYSQTKYGALYDEAMKAEVAELKGPVQLEEGYSVFRVIEKMGLEPDSFEEASSRARYWVRVGEEKKLISALLLSLKEKYASKVVLFEERLKRMNAEAVI